MRFDDRLSTVLGLSAEAPHDRAVQWRQLVELVARGAGSSDPGLLGRALAHITQVAPQLPSAVRAAAARAIAGPGLPVALVAAFAADEPEVLEPLLDSIGPGEASWNAIRAAASPAVRSLLDTRRPRSLVPDEHPPSETSAGAGLIRWECGPEGAIEWVEGAPRAALIGRSLREAVPQRFDAMQPFANAELALASSGELAGQWRWSGEPRFLPGSGRFAGYSGIARQSREVRPEKRAIPGLPAPIDHDSLRELIHELRTPLTAIIGFGEIIDGQFLGPAHRAYRDRAGEIVRQARLLLAAVEDLDLAARLRSGRLSYGEGAAVAPLLQPFSDKVIVALRDPAARCALEAGLAARLLTRFIETVTNAAAADEKLALVIDRTDPHVAIAIDRPAATRALSDEALLRPETPATLGFSLRLVRGLAVTSGGNLDIEPDHFILLLPAV